MTNRRPSIWPLWAWLMVAALLIVLAGGTLRRLFLPALALDLVSFWPVAALGLLMALAIWPFARRGPARLAAIGPLILITWVGVALWLHYSEWDQLPSVEADLVLAYQGETDVDLSVELDGELTVGPSADSLIEVSLKRRGGETGIPEALVDPGGGVVSVRETDGGDWFVTSGWNVALSTEPTWQLRLVADAVDVDVSALLIRGAEIRGNGTLVLPPVAEDVDVALGGELLVRIPLGVPVRIDGDATVPGDWQVIDGVVQSPEAGPGYLLRIRSDAAVTVRTR